MYYTNESIETCVPFALYKIGNTRRKWKWFMPTASWKDA